MSIHNNEANFKPVSLDDAFNHDAFNHDAFNQGASELDLGKTIRNIFTTTLKYWWMIILIFSAFMVIASLYVKRVQPMYRAIATVEIKQAETNILGQTSVSEIDANEEFLITQISLMNSDKIINGVVADLGLHNNANFSVLSGTRDERIRDATGKLRNRLNIIRQGQSRVIAISVDNENPVLAAKIANKLSENFSKYDQARKFESTAYARKFVQERLANMREALEQSEKELHDYSQSAGIVRNSSGNDSGADFLANETLKALNAELVSVRTKRIQIENDLKIAKESDLILQTQSNDTLKSVNKLTLDLQVEYQKKGQTLKPKHPEMLAIEAQIEALNSQVNKTKANILTSFETEIENLRRIEGQYAQNITQIQEDLVKSQSSDFTLNILNREVETNRSQYDALLQRLKEITIADGTGPDFISPVDAALPAQNPFSPNVPMIIAISGILSVFSSGILIVLMSALDDKIRRPDDIQEKLNIYTIGAIPMVKIGDESSFIEELENPLSITSESYSSLISSINMFRDGNEPLCLQVTSTCPNEGKSSSAIAICKSFSEAGSTVVLIDADLRKPGFNVDTALGSIGLSGLITGHGDFLKSLIPSTKFKNLSVLPAGVIPGNPVSMLMSPGFRAILEEAKSHFDVVIVDSPPVLGIADATVISSVVNGTLFVIEQGKLRSPHVRNSIKRLKNSGANIFGGILTKCNFKNKVGYGEYYYYSSQEYVDNPETNRNKSMLNTAGKTKKPKINF